MDTPLQAGPERTAETVGTVLLVDDDCLLLETTSRLLSALGFQVLEAVDGQDALDQYQAHRDAICLVIMDIVMPRMDGLEAARRIRALDPSAKVILSSGFTDRPITDAAADAFLPKPYRGRALCEAIQQVLQGSLKANLLKLGVYGTH